MCVWMCHVCACECMYACCPSVSCVWMCRVCMHVCVHVRACVDV